MAPVGFDGDTNRIALVRGVQDASSCSTVTRKPASTVVGTGTGTPPASATASGKVTQYGAGTMTSSPGSSSVRKVLAMACLPPLVITTWLGVISNPESRAVLAATASRSGWSPATAV